MLSSNFVDVTLLMKRKISKLKKVFDVGIMVLIIFFYDLYKMNKFNFILIRYFQNYSI